MATLATAHSRPSHRRPARSRSASPRRRRWVVLVVVLVGRAHAGAVPVVLLNAFKSPGRLLRPTAR